VPKEVREARRAGKTVIRQGEWFFIPAKVSPPKFSDSEKLMVLVDRAIDRYLPSVFEKVIGKKFLKDMKKKVKKSVDKMLTAKSLKAGDNRPNTAQYGFVQNGITYVSGVVKA
jgi:hypothetical protein